MNLTEPRPTCHADQQPVRRRSRFHFGMALAMSAVVFAGFAPSFYLRGLLPLPPGPASSRPMTSIILVHGIVFTAWMVMLTIQTGLVATGRARLHRQIGIAGAALAALVLASGCAAQFASMQRDVRSGGYDASAFLQSVVLSGSAALLLFAGLATAALCLRRHPAAHRRLIMLATIALLGAATARLANLAQLAVPALGSVPLLGLVLTDAFLVALLVHDWRQARRIHPATLVGTLAILAAQWLANSPVPGSAVVKQAVHWLAG